VQRMMNTRSIHFDIVRSWSQYSWIIAWDELKLNVC